MVTLGWSLPRTADRAAPTIHVGIDVVADKYHAGLQAENRDRVSAFGRQVFDRCGIEGVTLRGVLGVHEEM